MSVPYVYDAGALLAAERGDRRMVQIHHLATSGGTVPVVPAPVLSQVWRDGRRQALLARFLQGCRVEPFDEAAARATGSLLGRSATSDVVDAAVVVACLRLGAVVVTSDRHHLQHLVDAIGESLPAVVTV